MGSPDSGAETPTRPLDDHAQRESPGGVLDLAGRHPPGRPRGIVMSTIGIRVPPVDRLTLEARADRLGLTLSELCRRIITDEIHMPDDVRAWLRIQQAQTGARSETETVNALVRHLAPRWPFGCRLDP